MNRQKSTGGVSSPNKGQREMFKNITHKTLRTVDVGTRFGQYISHGMVTFAMSGKYNVKYSIITIEVAKHKTAKLR